MIAPLDDRDLQDTMPGPDGWNTMVRWEVARKMICEGTTKVMLAGVSHFDGSVFLVIEGIAGVANIQPAHAREIAESLWKHADLAEKE